MPQCGQAASYPAHEIESYALWRPQYFDVEIAFQDFLPQNAELQIGETAPDKAVYSRPV